MKVPSFLRSGGLLTLLINTFNIMIGSKSYTIRFNRSAKTYTIRVYEGGKLLSKYRSLHMGRSYCEHWSECDILNFLSYTRCYVRIR